MMMNTGRWCLIRAAVSSLLAAVLPLVSWSAEQKATADYSVINAASLTQVLLSLAAVIALIFVLGRYARRLQGFSIGNHQSMRIVASLSVGAREKILLVQIGEQQLLLGVASGRVNLLQSFDEPVIQGASSTDKQSFISHLKSALHNTHA